MIYPSKTSKISSSPAVFAEATYLRRDWVVRPFTDQQSQLESGYANRRCPHCESSPTTNLPFCRRWVFSGDMNRKAKPRFAKLGQTKVWQKCCQVALQFMTIRLPLHLYAACATALLVGCVGGPNHDFYRPTGRSVAQPFKGKAALIQSEDMGRDVRRYVDEGYTLIGTSDYNGKYPEMVELTAQAKKVGASVVVFNGRYIGTVTGVSSFSLPNPPQTVASQTYGNVYGYGGSASYSGTTTTTIPGGYTQYQIPYAIDRFEVHEAFLGR